MFTLFGILFLILAIAGAVVSRIESVSLFQNWKRIYSIGLASFGVVLMMLPHIFFYADAGTAYAVQYPNGTKEAVFTQGLHMKWFGRVIPVQFEIPIKYAEKQNMGEISTEVSDEGQYIHMYEAKQWEFNDAVKADISTSVVISVNTVDEEGFLKLADRNKSEDNLVNARILPNINQAIKNTCKLMSAQDYISGKAADFDRWFKDQLENGMYILERVEVEEAPDIIASDSTIRTVTNADNTSNQQVYYRIKRKPNGEPYREDGNSLRSYGLTVIQAVVDEINWEKAFDDRLTLQKNEVAQTQLEKQQAEKEFYRAQKEIAKGEADKASEQAKLEKEQIQKTIDAETKVKVAEKKLQEEKTLYEVAQYQSKTKKIQADAQAYENQRLVSAGLTPQEKMKMEIEIADRVSKNIAGPDGLKLPEQYINSGGGNGSSKDDMMMMILMEMMRGNKK